MTARHSPGPFRSSAAIEGLIVDANGNNVAIMFGLDGPEQPANFRLLVAAPGLLLAAKNALAHLTGGMDGEPLDEDPVALLQAAIAEVEGRS